MRFIIEPIFHRNELGYIPLERFDLYAGDEIAIAMRLQTVERLADPTAQVTAIMVFVDTAGDVVSEAVIGSALPADGIKRIERSQYVIPAGADAFRFELQNTAGNVFSARVTNIQINYGGTIQLYTVPAIAGPQGPKGDSGDAGPAGSRTARVYFASVNTPAAPTSDQLPPANWSLTPQNPIGDQLIWISERLIDGEGSWVDPVWSAPANIRGPEGPQGPLGEGLNIDGTLAVPGDLPVSGDFIGQTYLIGTDLYVWNGTDWVVVGSALGPQGPEGEKGLQWQGPWDIATVYAVDDVVSHEGSAWVAVDPSTGEEPGVSVDWQLVAEAGVDGAAGAVGPQGPIGPAGPPADLSGGRTTRGATWLNPSGSALTVPINDVAVFVPADTAITRIIVAGDVVGSCEVEIFKTTTPELPVDPADSIGTFSVTAQQAVETTDLTGITTFVEARTWLVFRLNSVSDFTTLYFTLELAAIMDGGAVDHSVLGNLAADDHPQYYNQARGDARYSQIGHAHAASAITSGLFPVSRGGTGIGAVPEGSYLRGTVGDALEARTLNQLRTDLALPGSFAAIKVKRTTQQGVLDGSSVGVEFNSLSFNVGDFVFTSGTNFVEVPTDGYYQIDAGLEWEALLNGARRLQVVAPTGKVVAQSLLVNEGSLAAAHTVSALVYLTAGQTIGVSARFDAIGEAPGVSSNIQGSVANDTVFLSVARVG